MSTGTGVYQLPTTRVRNVLSVVLALLTLGVATSDASDIAGTTSLRVERRGHAATALPGGKVLITGGENRAGLVPESEIYDPQTRTFTVAARTLEARSEHTASLLADGRILIVGGRGRDGALASTESYSPASGTFSSGPVLNQARFGQSATPLADGRIVVIGGDAEGTAEVFDPRARTFTSLPCRLTDSRSFHAAVRLADGSILIAGGIARDGAPLRSAEVLHPDTLNCQPVSMMHVARSRFTLRLLPDGKVQAIGGDTDRTMELFNPAGYFSSLVHLAGTANSESAALRTSGRVAIIGPSAPSLLDEEAPLVGGRGLPRIVQNLLDRSDYSMTEIPETGEAIAAGGVSSSGRFQSVAVLFESSSATVTTDKTDYAPGDTVVITGSGWLPGETVTLNIHRDTNDPPDTVLSAAADANGNISNSEYVVQNYDLGVSFLLTATGQSSGYSAQTSFTDGNLDTTLLPASVTASAGGPSQSFTIRSTATGGIGSGWAFSVNTLYTVSGGVCTGSTPSASIPVAAQGGSGSQVFDTAASVSVAAGQSPGTFACSVNETISASGNNPNLAPAGAATLTVIVPACTEPSITAPPAVTAFTGAGATSCSAVVSNATLGIPTTSGGCGTVSVAPSGIPAGNVFPLGTTTITWTATDSSGNSATATQSVTVSDNTPPTITAPGPVSYQCVGDVPAANPADASASDNCGTATVSISESNNGGAGTTASPLVITRTYTANDGHGNTATATQTITVIDNTPPTITAPANINASTGPGATSCSVVVSNLGTPSTSDNCGGSVTVTPSGIPAVNVFPVGTTTITYTANDGHGNTATATQTVTVIDNTLPTVGFTPPAAAHVGAGCTASVPPVAILASDNCTPSGSLTVAQSPTAGTLLGPGTYPISVTVTDAAGNSATVGTNFTVLNDVPSILSVTGPADPLQKGDPATVTLSFTDESQGHTCTFTWDDGTSTGPVPAVGGSCSDSHTYAATGVYGVTVTVTDDCGSSASAVFEFIVIYDPNGGFVTGGGWIDSPVGASPEYPNATGKANFGFVSKYQKGSNVPTGETEFQFKADDLNFHSSVYDLGSLVISGYKAQYRGSGTVNGVSGYRFVLTAYDGQVTGGGGVDKFRIKITDGGTVIYDNRIGASEDIDTEPTAISGGSIVIHKGK